MNKSKIDIITFGCRLNIYESEVIRNILTENNIILPKNKKIVIFNSCVVTKEAERQLRQAIRKIKREEMDNVLIGVIGCAVQVNKDFYINMPEVDFVIGNNAKLELNNYKNLSEKCDIVYDNLENNNDFDNYLLSGFENKSRAFVQIQNGCNNKCTFCLTRFARGKNVSFNSSKIIEQIRKLIDNSYKEIVLTGINISDYGNDIDKKTNLGTLIRKILKETDIERLRLSSLDISDLNGELLDVIKTEDRVMPHLHLSLQSGNNIILKRMMRRHTKEDIFRICYDILNSRPKLIFGADFIAGFPTESDDMHKDSLEVIKKVPITYGHIFPYSERPGTKAALMPQLPKKIRKLRAKELRDATGYNLNNLIKSLSGTKQKVLIESKNNGRLENYLQIKLPLNYKGSVGEIVEMIV